MEATAMEDRKETVMDITAQTGTRNNVPFPAGDHVACIGEKCTQNFDWEIRRKVATWGMEIR